MAVKSGPGPGSSSGGQGGGSFVGPGQCGPVLARLRSQCSEHTGHTESSLKSELSLILSGEEVKTIIIVVTKYAS